MWSSYFIIRLTAEGFRQSNPPSEAEVLAALLQGPREVPAVLKVFRDDMRLVTTRLAGEVDPARLFPLVGVVELHHYHWKCTAYYSETMESGYPLPLRSKRPRVEVVYIDKDYPRPRQVRERACAEATRVPSA